ncbi:hypothetical protein D9619_002318 [Psilocybe cf. subviscida]|uniref:Uncharacterized protein n=1 Tax=Psilocybe cf. subviscida TaxID=2480587 RepID=A0A8H5AVS9_9AGAR|nr:hypothetical protein D9619_002318 [Psilocybe cf. subviscida]
MLLVHVHAYGRFVKLVISTNANYLGVACCLARRTGANVAQVNLAVDQEKVGKPETTKQMVKEVAKRKPPGMLH